MRYLDDYASDIKPMIKFEHDVEYVKPITVGSKVEWDILVKSSSGHRVEKFDAVIVANGHCASPLLPDIEGLETWCRELPDSIYHSVSYKNPESFENKVSKSLTFFSHFVPQHQYPGQWDTNQHSSEFSSSEVAPQAQDIERQIAQVCKTSPPRRPNRKVTLPHQRAQYTRPSNPHIPRCH